jgi:hypothetical protein
MVCFLTSKLVNDFIIIIIIIVTYRPIARQPLGKHIPVEASARNNRTSITRQRIGENTP